MIFIPSRARAHAWNERQHATFCSSVMPATNGVIGTSLLLLVILHGNDEEEFKVLYVFQTTIAQQMRWHIEKKAQHAQKKIA